MLGLDWVGLVFHPLHWGTWQGNYQTKSGQTLAFNMKAHIGPATADPIPQITILTSPAPEPETMLLSSIGVLAVYIARRKSKA